MFTKEDVPMAQVKIYGNKKVLTPSLKVEISTAIHNAVMHALEYPPEKKFHRFIELEEGRSEERRVGKECRLRR